MEHIYALGVSCIELIQYWFEGWSWYMEMVNHLANPHYVLEILFPLVSILDSVFASQLLLCISFGGWLNGLMKWGLLEDRPYWWVRETTFYNNTQRPNLLQTSQTCETGPGCPSGHTVTASMVLILAVMWSSHVYNDMKWNPWLWKRVAYPTFAVMLGSVMLARMYVATHFPHQCIVGALLGLAVAPMLCIFVSDPFIWRYGTHSTMHVMNAKVWHIICALLTILIAVVIYYSLVLCGVDPQFTVQLAVRWCFNRDFIHVSTTPMFALVQCTGTLLGWAFSVYPVVAKYRYYTKERSLVISTFATGLTMYFFKQMEAVVAKETGIDFYALHFILNVFRPALFLKFVPAIAAFPWSGSIREKFQ